MPKRIKWIIIILAALLVILSGTAVFLHLRNSGSYDAAENYMPSDGILTLYEKENGMLLLQWPEGANADLYQVTIHSAKTGWQLYASDYTKDRNLTFAPPTTEEDVTIRVTSYAIYRNEGSKKDQYRPCAAPLEATTSLAAPRAEDLQWTVDPARKLVSAHIGIDDAEVCRMYLDGKLQRIIHEDQFTITFGEKDNYPLPPQNDPCTFTFDIYREAPGVIFYGLRSEALSVDRNELLEKELHLDYTHLGENLYELSWNETRGDYYDLQTKDRITGQWVTLVTVPRDWERSHTLQLDPLRQYEFRITATGGELIPGTAEAAIPDQIELFTHASAQYCTIWPQQKLNVYQDVDLTQPLTSVNAGTALCVLKVEGSVFLVRTDKGEGYIDSNYCMINLPEYLGGLCSYDIVNAYDCLYMVHEYEIPTITGGMITGYETVKGLDGTFLVPLLFPTAQKLQDAAITAMAQGYRLKIYDAYRPRNTTLHIYNVASAILHNPIPETTFTGVELTDLPVLPEGESLTYHKLMTDSGRYALANFLANGGSNHNLGVALDLTLESVHTGQEISMQSSMHDLSWYSELSRNNETANLLSKIMISAGFGDLKSEWWHFQDNHAKDQLNLQLMREGVSAQCWMKDDNGWRYRMADGTYLTYCAQEIDGTIFYFDENGYQSEEPIIFTDPTDPSAPTA